jgi:hypothetical protein
MNICEDAPAIAQGRELQEAAPAPIFCFFMAFGMNLARFLRMVCQLFSFNCEVGAAGGVTARPVLPRP